MGEKAEAQGRGVERLPAAAPVAIGALVGAVLAAPIAVAVTGGDDTEDVVAIATTTTGATTTTVATSTTEAVPTNPQGVFDVTLTVVTSEIAGEAFEGNDPFPPGSTLPGGTLECDGATCVFAIAIANLDPIEMTLVDGRAVAEYTYDFRTNNACAGTGTANGSGTITLVAVADGYSGEVTMASEVFDTVPGDGTFCSGSRDTMSISTEPG